MVRYENFDTHAIPSITTVDKIQVDRIQNIDISGTLNREKNKEVGRDGTIDYSKRTPTVGYRLTQNESQNIKFFKALANVSGNSVSLGDFKTSATDLLAFLKDDNGVQLGTIWYPKLRVAGFSINVADPDAKIERSFDLVGDALKEFQGNQKYVIYKMETVDSAEVVADDWTITLNDPTPVEDEKTAGKYIMRVTRIRSGVSTDLSLGTGTNQYEYNSGAGVLTVHDAQVSDVYKIWYTAGSLPSGDTTWTNNDSDVGATLAYNVSMTLGGVSLDKLQSVGIDVRFDREDNKEVGNREVTQRGITNKTVTLSIPRLLETYAIEEILLGKSSGFGHIDPEDYLDNIPFVMKVYSDVAKTNFKWGVKITNMSPTEDNISIAIDGYTNKNLTLESETMIISDNEADLA
ncbi:MAG: hypothetical protein DRJ38_05440 [Thermoprotei archaeon]|nr:MAG: hypothetical protein DRJ38_05440 [Thermoprotei archaeon]